MKMQRALPALGILSAFVSAATITLAQSAVPSAPLFADTVLAPSSSSSSSSSELFYAAPAASSSAASAAQAKPADSGNTRPFSSVGVGFQIGLGGVGFNVATPLLPGTLNLRGGAGFFSYTYNGTISNEPVNAKLKLNNAEVMVDWFPFHGGFRLSAGTTVYNTTGLNGTVTVNSGTTLKIGSDTYLSAPTTPLTGNLGVGFGGKAVPRFTLGWGNMVPKKGHIKFETEIGVEIIGTPSVSWTYGGNACLETNGSTCSNYAPINTIPSASADIASQDADLQKDVNSVKVFPVFQLGLSYKIH